MYVNIIEAKALSKDKKAFLTMLKDLKQHNKIRLKIISYYIS